MIKGRQGREKKRKEGKIKGWTNQDSVFANTLSVYDLFYEKEFSRENLSLHLKVPGSNPGGTLFFPLGLS